MQLTRGRRPTARHLHSSRSPDEGTAAGANTRSIRRSHHALAGRRDPRTEAAAGVERTEPRSMREQKGLIRDAKKLPKDLDVAVCVRWELAECPAERQWQVVFAP